MGQTIRFYTDEHVPRAVVRGLRQRGVDVLTVSEAGLLGASDEAHLGLAVKQGRVIVTQDEEFLRLHASGGTHAGIVFVSRVTTIGDFIRGLLLIQQVLSAADMQNHVEFV